MIASSEEQLDPGEGHEGQEQDLGLGATERLHLYDDLFSGELFGLYRASMTGRMLSCNQALAHLLGYADQAELIRIPVSQHYFDVVERQHFLDDLLEKKQLSNYEVLLKHRSGRPVHVLENVVLREEPGSPSVIEGVVIDITALRESELEQRILANNYRQLTERVRDGLIVLKNGKLVYANPAAEELLGHRQLPGKEFMDLVAQEDQASAEEILAEVRSGKNPNGTRIGFKGEKGRVVNLLVHGTTTWHMNGAAVQLTLQDIEAQRQEINEHLRATMNEEMGATLREEILEHKRTQEALEQSRRLARSLIDSSLDMIVAVDPKGIITEFNPAASIKFGYEPEEVLGKHSSVLYATHEDYERVQGEMDRYNAYAGEVQNVTREGRVFVSFLASSRLRDEDGALLGSMGVSRDVTQAKRDREALLESEERYRDVVDNATDMIHTVDAKGKFLFVNKAWCKTFGYTDKDLKTLTFYDIMEDSEDLAKAKRWMDGDRGPDGNKAWHTVFRAKDGRRLICEGTSNVGQVEGQMVMARSILRDVTASREAQEKLRHHSAKEKALFESGDYMFWTVDNQYRLTSFNQAYKEMIVRLYGKEPQLQVGTADPKKLFAPTGYHDFWARKYDEVFATGKKMRFETHPQQGGEDGVWNEIFLSPVLNERGEVEEVFGIGNEVTAERKIEAMAREQSAKLNAIFEGGTNMMIWTMDRNRQITSCNRNFMHAAKESFGEVMGVGSSLRRSFIPFISEEDDRAYQRMMTTVLNGRHGNHEVALHHPNGSTLWVEIFASPIITEGEVKEISVMAHDITEKKKIEQAVLESLREKEVLLKEVHHRVKNNLQIISSIFSLQQGHVDQDERLIQLLRESQDRIRSMAFIHESLYLNKNFTQVDLAGYIRDLCRNLVMSYALNGRVNIETDLQPLMLDLDKAIPCGLVLNELISNSLKHGFPEGEEGKVSITLRQDGDLVKIELADNGRGFPKNYVDARDRGLGTELVEVLMEQLDGNVKRTDAVKGTTYLITFERSR